MDDGARPAMALYCRYVLSNTHTHSLTFILARVEAGRVLVKGPVIDTILGGGEAISIRLVVDRYRNVLIC